MTSDGRAALTSGQARRSIVVTIEGLHHRGGAGELFSGLNMELGHGEIAVVAGLGDAARSLLPELLSGERRVQRGRIGVCGQDPSRLPQALLTRIGVVRVTRQLAANDPRSVLDQVIEAAVGPMAQNDPGGRQAVERLARRALVACGLDHWRQRCAGTLPAGLRRRVELAMALVVSPRLIVLDEPFRDLPPAEHGPLIQALRMAAGRGTTCLILTGERCPAWLGACDRAASLPPVPAEPARVPVEPAVELRPAGALLH